MKKILSVFFAVCMLVTSSAYVLAEEEAIEADYALFSAEGTNVNIKHFGNNGQTGEIDGRKAVKMDSTVTNPFISLNVSDAFIYNENAEQPVVVSVEYYDEGQGSFTIAYDGINNKKYDKWQTEGEIVKLEDTKEWKTHEFYLEDIKFANTFVGGTDFRIGLWSNTMGRSSEDVYFASIKIEKTHVRNPVKESLSSAYYGNMFGPNDEKKMTLELENIADVDVNAKIKYTMLDSNDNVFGEGELEEAFEPKQTRSEIIDVSSLEKFGLYTFNLSIETNQVYNGKEITETKEKILNFSYINKPEVVNKHQYASVHGLRLDVKYTPEIARYAGFGGVREDVLWSSMETEKGKIEVPENTDKYIGLLNNNGLDLLLVAAYGNTLYINDPAYPNSYVLAPFTDAGIEAYTRYCAYVAEKYKGVVNNFEIWNEYNHRGFNPRGEDGAMYAKMLKAAYTAIKKVNPDATVVGMDTAGADLDFMREVLEAGGYDYMDAVSCHPYDWSGQFDLEKFIRTVRAVDDLFEEYGGKKPQWFTELGSSSSLTSDGVGEDMQAVYAVQIYATSQGENLCERTYWYDLINDGNSLTARENCFGIVRSSTDPGGAFAAKPAMVSMTGMNNFLGDAEPVDSIKTDDGVYAYRFKKESGEEVIAAWSVSDVRNFALNLGCSEAEVFDINTNSLGKVTSSNGVFNLTLEKHPIYIKGKFPNFKEADKIITQDILDFKTVAGDDFTVEFSDSLGRDLTIEADVPPYVSVVENSGVHGGKGSITFTTAENGRKFDINLRIKDEEKITSLGKVKVEVVEPLGLTILGTQQISENDSNHWQVKVRVRNYSNQKPFSGNCILENSEGNVLGKSVGFFGLKPESDVTLYMNLPTLVKKRIQDVKVKLNADNGFCAEADSTLDFSGAKYASNAPTIDGKIDRGEWIGTWVTADEEKNVRNMTWDGTADCSYDAIMMWDEDCFYMAAKVVDDVHYNEETAEKLWNGDSLQFALKHYEDDVVIVDQNGVNSDFTEIGAALIPTGPVVYRFKSMNDKQPVGIIENVDIKIVRNGNKTIYEMAVPWSELFYEGYSVKENSVMGFSLLVNDNDSFGRGWLQYMDGIGVAKNASLFGQMTLSK